MNNIGIAKIPVEVTELALIHSHPRDVSAFAQTCRSFRSLVYANDTHLWRLLWFSQGFEDPRLGDYGILPPKPFRWRIELQRRIKAEAIAIGGFDAASPEDRLELLQTLVDAIQTIPAHGLSDASEFIEQPRLWLMQLMQTAGLLSRPTKETPESATDLEEFTVYEAERRDNFEELLLRHRLHAYLGPSTAENDEEICAKRRNEARCFVYDLRNYNDRSGWGPLTPNHVGQVNWMHVDHIIEVITRNLDDHGPLWSGPNRPPLGFDSIRPYSAPGSLGRGERDWAAVEGKWRRIVCFMDYRDLYVYNAAHAGRDTPRDHSVFDQTDFEEATRFIYLELHIAGYSPTYSANPVPLKSADAKSIKDLGPRPTIHFTGTSKGGSGNEASVRGLVRMTKDNNIRWSFVSIYDSLVQWRSEGVQVGNVASAMGVVGSWTGTNRAPGEPAGPFWLWKSGHLEHCHKCGRRM